MIATALFLAAAAASAPPPPEVQNEIVVIGRRLEKRWKGRFAKIDGRLTCKTTRSTGDAAIDAIGCGALLTCIAEVEPQIDAIAAASDLPQRERNRRIDLMLQSTVPCITEYRETAIARLAAARTKS